jgi:hypothetical protein
VAEPTLAVAEPALAEEVQVADAEPALGELAPEEEQLIKPEAVETETSISPAEPATGSAQVEEEELMWLGDEFAPERSQWSSSSVPSSVVAAAEDQALTRLAAERGWDDEELRAIRSLLQPEPAAHAPEQAPAEDLVAPESEAPESEAPESEAPESDAPDEPMASDLVSFADEEALDWEQGPTAWTPEQNERRIELPGAAELDEAMAALEASPATARPAGLSDEQEPNGARVEAASEEHGAVWSKSSTTAGGEPVSAQSSSPNDPGPPFHTTGAGVSRVLPNANDVDDADHARDDDWLHGRRGPAANAYRRLRRLFPG